jgi:hypothetical protein
MTMLRAHWLVTGEIIVPATYQHLEGIRNDFSYE